MRRTFLKQTLVVIARSLAPPRISVIPSLIRKNEHILFELNYRVNNPGVVVCHAGSIVAEGDMAWRRPEPSPDRPSSYGGPPAGEPPPADWHPPMAEPIAPPRKLPDIDHDAVDLEEEKAARITYAIAFAALGVLLLLSCWRFS